MLRVAALLLVFVAVLSANPWMPVVISEIQAAPDSLERVELHQYAGFAPGETLDLSGVPLITNAGVAIIDSGVVLPAASYVVIDSTNTTGVFSLGDDSDYIRLVIPYQDTFTLRYPDNPHWTSERSWVPPPRTSAALHRWTVWDQYFIEHEFYTWYVDTTPTFGASNDDNGGGIWGFVLSPDSQQAIAGATVQIASMNGTATIETDGNYGLHGRGYYEEKPTGPGEFVLTAEYPGYLPYVYPETIQLAPNEDRWINIYLQLPGAVVEPPGSAAVVALRQRGRMLVLDADRPGTAFVYVYDNLGRVRITERVPLKAGSNELAMSGIGRGVYFANCRCGERTLNTKFVLY